MSVFTRNRLIVTSLRGHWRLNLSIACGVALTTAVLCGALAVGDSVRASLRRLHGERLGRITQALVLPEDRFVRAALADELAATAHAEAAGVIVLQGSCATPDGKTAAAVQVVGVPDGFFALGNGATAPALPALNRAAATALSAAVGDNLILRVTKPDALSREAPMSSTEESDISIRFAVEGIADTANWERFSLSNEQTATLTLFVPLALLQEKLALADKVNTILLHADDGAALETAVETNMQLTDAGLRVAPTPDGRWEVRSPQIFMLDSVVESLLTALPGSEPVLGYFANRLVSEAGKTTPYSMVAAVPLPQLELSAATLPVVTDEGDEPPPPVVISRWLADDLGVKAGDGLGIEYFIMDQGRRLREDAAWFRIAAVIEMDHPLIDSTLMPDFPGISESESCFDWEPGVPIKLDRIRDKDEAYWKKWRGAPKAFVPLAMGRNLWGSAFGQTTGIRFAAADRATAEAAVRRSLTARGSGLRLRQVAAEADAAIRGGVDFGGLFIGMSFFLMLSALVLTGMLAGFHLENRSAESGTLRALGYSAARVRAQLLWEAAACVTAGAAAGAIFGLAYAGLLVWGLNTAWQGAVGMDNLRLEIKAATVLGGMIGGAGLTLLVIWLGARRQARQASIRAMQQQSGPFKVVIGRRAGWAVAAVLLACALSALASHGGGAEAQAMRFFGGGAALLGSGLAAIFASLTGRGDSRPCRTFSQLGRLGMTRRRWRSLTVAGTVASGVFLVIAVGANRKQPPAADAGRESPTGGYDLIVEVARPIYQDPADPEGRKALGLDLPELEGAAILPCRVRAGDDASCLNITQAQQPMIVGVDPHALARRDSFTFAQSIAAANISPWYLLLGLPPDGAVPAILDANTAMWALKIKLGETFTVAGDNGEPVSLRLVALLKPGILQGRILISSQRLQERFPSVDGFAMLLVDTPGAAAPAGAALRTVLADQGAVITPAGERLARLEAVENTYLSVFQVLGGLGMILGALGIGIVLARSVAERRGELAVLAACGYRRARIRSLLLIEHGGLLLLGVALGTICGLTAAYPGLHEAGEPLPVAAAVGVGVAVAAAGVAALLAAARAAVDPIIRRTLQNE